ncbi:MAG: thymidine phosphorylase [Defluviitaleaceae bacterium]|nr:thymidine phosphorylase [Defluviitaleaceae bacterium]
MRTIDLINKKKSGKPLSADEISFIIDGFTNGIIPDYQMSALLMAICFKGMNPRETAELTLKIAHSGELVRLPSIGGIKVDKHSTGGVGDKTTLIISPIVAACGVSVAKMSGRGLGHTGGTIDKLGAIPGFKTALNREEFGEIVKGVGVCITSASENIAPADKKLYALRDVTGTVDSMPLIAASIMSKKIASPSDAVLLDVKTGKGAFMTSLGEAVELAKIMVDIGEFAGKKTNALITNMDIPLGESIGNTLEIIESVEVLKGRGDADLASVCKLLAAHMLLLADKGSLEECVKLVEEALKSGRALAKFMEMVEAQGGKLDFNNFDNLPKASIIHKIKSPRTGYICEMDALSAGIASSVLGAGREREDSEIDYGAGIWLHKKYGDYVEEGELLATFYTSDNSKIEAAAEKFMEAIKFDSTKPPQIKLIYAFVSKAGVEYL